MRRLVPLVAAVVLLGAGACSDGSTALTAGGLQVRTIDMVMTEMKFTPSKVVVTAGETITFHFTNEGKIRHEAVIGDQAAQDEAVRLMAQMGMGSTTTGPGRSRRARAHPGMGLPNVISLEAGQSGDMTFTFGKVGELLIECHESGHLEAGMKATLTVRPR